MRLTRLLPLMINALFACAGPQSGAKGGPAPELPAGATYSDLVKVLALDDGNTGVPGCLLARSSAGFKVKARLLRILKIVPQPTKDLDSIVRHAKSVRILSPRGFHGTALPEQFGLVALTATPPAPSIYGVVLTDEGLYLRSPDILNASAPMTLAALEGALALFRVKEIFFTAEADVPVEQVFRTLKVLEHHGAVALAVMVQFGDDTTRPALGVCPSEGSITGMTRLHRETPVALTDAQNARLSDDETPFYRCLQKSRAKAVVGRVLLVKEVREDGSIKAACITEDPVGDAELNRCVLDHLKIEVRDESDRMPTTIVYQGFLPEWRGWYPNPAICASW